MSKASKDNKDIVTSTTDVEKDKDSSSTIAEYVKSADFYHGLIPRTDIEPLLKNDGDFLLRKTEHNPGVIILALSARHNGGIKHFMVNQDQDGSFYFEHHHEKTIDQLITWHKDTQTPLSNATPVCLKKPIGRPSWLLNHDAIKLAKKIGEGAFGEVYFSSFASPEGEVQVAVKTMRGEVTREARLKFMKEARLMRKLQHKHIVKIMGVAVHEYPIMLVIELCLGGSLLKHLQSNKGKLTMDIKLRFCVESASGLAYLERQNFIHRDIAARNCLLSDKNEIKISDFGMSDERKELTDEKLGKVPVKWLAPETLQNKVYNNKTDVWSFGVLVYEIYSEGAKPYPGLTNAQVREKVVTENFRMDMPKDTPTPVAKLTIQSWSKDPNDRPTFAKIHEQLKEFRNNNAGKDDKTKKQ